MSRMVRIHGEMQSADPTGTAQISAMAHTRDEVETVMKLHGQGWPPSKIAQALAQHKKIDLKTLDIHAHTPQTPPQTQAPVQPQVQAPRSGSVMSGGPVDDNF